MKTMNRPVRPITVEPAPQQTEPFPPSAELGEELCRVEAVQAAIDRRKAEELAKLRAIQDRD